MSPIHRSSLMLSLVATGVLAAAPVLPAALAEDDAGNEILVETGAKWTLKGSKVTGTLTNGNAAQLDGLGKLTVTPRSTKLTLAKGTAFSIASRGKAKVTFTLTKTGKSYFKKRSKARVDMDLAVKAGGQTGTITTDVVVRKG